MEELYERIERYAENELSDEARAAFEAECLRDESMMRELAFYLSSKQAILSIQEDQLKQSWIDTYRENRSGGKRVRFYSLLAAAALIAILLISYLSIRTSRTDLADVYISYYEVPPSLITRGPEPQAFKQAFEAYDKADYTGSIGLFQQAISVLSDPDSIQTLRYFLGNAYLNVNQADSAIAQFEQIDTTHQFTKGARWYTALAFVKLTEPEKAILELDSLLISPGTQYYQRQATSLREALQKWEE